MRTQIPILIMFTGVLAMQAYALWVSDLNTLWFSLTISMSVFFFLLGQQYAAGDQHE
jgi:hypothetical protein